MIFWMFTDLFGFSRGGSRPPGPPQMGLRPGYHKNITKISQNISNISENIKGIWGPRAQGARGPPLIFFDMFDMFCDIFVIFLWSVCDICLYFVICFDIFVIFCDICCYFLLFLGGPGPGPRGRILVIFLTKPALSESCAFSQTFCMRLLPSNRKYSGVPLTAIPQQKYTPPPFPPWYHGFYQHFQNKSKKVQTEKSQKLIKFQGISTSSTSQTRDFALSLSLRRTRGANSLNFDEFLRFFGLKCFWFFLKILIKSVISRGGGVYFCWHALPSYRKYSGVPLTATPGSVPVNYAWQK